MIRFNFALNYSRVQPSRASRTFVPKRGSNITKIDYSKLNAKQKASASARAKAKSSKRSAPKKSARSKKVENALNKVTESALEKFEPSNAIRTALKVASRMELKSPSSGVTHGSGPWMDSQGKKWTKYFTTRAGETNSNNLVDQNIGFGNKSTCYKEETILGDPKTMPSSRIVISNTVPLYDSSYRATEGMSSGFWKAEIAQKIKAGINMNAHRVFYHPLPEAQLRRLRDPNNGNRIAPFSCGGSNFTTHFDPETVTQINSVYHPYKLKDKYIFTNLESLTNAKVTVKIIQLFTEKDNDENDPRTCLSQMVGLIPTKFVPSEDGSSFTPPGTNYSQMEDIGKFVQSQTGLVSDHKGFGQDHASTWGGANFWTTKDYSVNSSTISDQMNVLKTSHRTLRPGETWQFEIDSFVNRDISQAGNISAFLGARDCIRDSYHIMVSINGASCTAYNARPSVVPATWKVEDRKYMRCNSSATVGVRQMVEYEDYSFREPKDNSTYSDVEPAALFVKAYRAKPELNDVHRTIYCIPENVVSTESAEEIPIGDNSKFLIPIATRAVISTTAVVKA